MNSRFRQIIQIRKSGKTVIQDRTIYEDAYIFAPNLHSMNLMSTRDFERHLAADHALRGFALVTAANPKAWNTK